MNAPCIEVDLNKIRYNTRYLVGRLTSCGINVTGVTKAVCGHPAIGNAMLAGGATELAEARVANVERLRRAGIKCPISMIRTPMLSQVDQIVRICETSYNTEIDVIERLAAAARKIKTIHNIVLMVEMGDMREGVMPKDLEALALEVLKMPGVALKGIGANFACLTGKAPDAAAMAIFSALANEIEGACGHVLATVSGGNSANLSWALRPGPTGRISDLRLGEAILLGIDPGSGNKISGLFDDAITLTAEVIEAKVKPEPVVLAFPNPAVKALRLVQQNHHNARSILAIGEQDTDTLGLTPPAGITLLGATSDHMVVQTSRSELRAGSELKFQLNYSALMRAMNAPDVAKIMHNEIPLQEGIQQDLSAQRPSPTWTRRLA